MRLYYWTHPAFWNSRLQLLRTVLFCSFVRWKYCMKKHFPSNKRSMSTRETYRACQYNDHHYSCFYKATAKSRIYNFLWSSFSLMMECTHRMMGMASGGFLSVYVSSRMHISLPECWGKCTQAPIQCFRYCSVLQKFKTILMFPSAIRPQSGFVEHTTEYWRWYCDKITGLWVWHLPQFINISHSDKPHPFSP
jgi:hypothetical protein